MGAPPNFWQGPRLGPRQPVLPIMNVANFTQYPETELMVSVVRPCSCSQSVDEADAINVINAINSINAVNVGNDSMASSVSSSVRKAGKFRVCAKHPMRVAGGST
jgi:hypothetical protein